MSPMLVVCSLLQAFLAQMLILTHFGINGNFCVHCLIHTTCIYWMLVYVYHSCTGCWNFGSRVGPFSHSASRHQEDPVPYGQEGSGKVFCISSERMLELRPGGCWGGKEKGMSFRGNKISVGWWE